MRLYPEFTKILNRKQTPKHHFLIVAMQAGSGGASGNVLSTGCPRALGIPRNPTLRQTHSEHRTWTL